MKAAVVVDGELAVETVDDPVPGEGQVLVAPRATGICGSDLHMFDAMKGRPADPSVPPIVPGHELCAVIVDHGPGTDSAFKAQWPVGTLVCANPFVGDGHELVGASPRRPGGLAELSVLDAIQLLRVPEGVPAEHAALTEPLAVGVRAVAAAGRRSDRGPYVVIGCGPIGLAVIMALRAEGRGPIIASDLTAERRALAERVGAEVVVDPAAGSPFQHLEAFGFVEAPPSPVLHGDRTAPLGPVVFECVGVPGIIQSLVDTAPRHTQLVVVGVCMSPDTVVPVTAVMKEVSVEFVLAYRPSELQESLRRIAQGLVDATSLITATVPLEQAASAVEALRRGEQGKVLVRPTA